MIPVVAVIKQIQSWKAQSFWTWNQSSVFQTNTGQNIMQNWWRKKTCYYISNARDKRTAVEDGQDSPPFSNIQSRKNYRTNATSSS